MGVAFCLLVMDPIPSVAARAVSYSHKQDAGVGGPAHNKQRAPVRAAKQKRGEIGRITWDVEGDVHGIAQPDRAY